MLEYIINKGKLSDFEQDFEKYYIRSLNGKNLEPIRRHLMNKYGFNKEEYIHNYFTHMQKIKEKHDLRIRRIHTES